MVKDKVWIRAFDKPSWGWKMSLKINFNTNLPWAINSSRTASHKPQCQGINFTNFQNRNWNFSVILKMKIIFSLSRSWTKGCRCESRPCKRNLTLQMCTWHLRTDNARWRNGQLKPRSKRGSNILYGIFGKESWLASKPVEGPRRFVHSVRLSRPGGTLHAP